MIKPGVLKYGDVIGVVAPSGPPREKELAMGVERLEKLGFKVRLGYHISKRWRHLSAEDSQRVEDLHRFFSDPGIRAIVCARGGSGAARLIPHLDFSIIKANPKIFVGSSDVTTLLLCLTQTCGIVAFHGPMVAPNFGKKPAALTDDFFLKLLTQQEPAGQMDIAGVKILKTGTAEGALTGGCLTILSLGLGTPHAVKTRGSILFLEDIDEAPYKIDRMLTHLKQASCFKNVRGIVFGKMVNCQPKPDEGYTLEDVILDVLSDFRGPILYGFPSGHGEENVTLPFGVKVRISQGGIEILESAVS
jgi:muramoyltetrapeptide carboxypeptidase